MSQYAPPYLLNLDLCVLVYQLYHQTAIFPLDPWYAVMARKMSDRRTNFMKKVHQEMDALGDPTLWYSGPASARGWGQSNKALDPVITNYTYMDPRRPTFNRDAGQFIVGRAPDYIVDDIKWVEMCTYAQKPRLDAPLGVQANFRPVQTYTTGTDHLIAFEGGTGTVEGTTPAWSVMGCVLARTRGNTNKYDLHIVFRGSRSGSALRAASKAKFKKGNPDWVTDLDVTNRRQRPWVSKKGKAARGFADAVKTSFGTIVAACDKLHGLYGKPEQIWITGHSLGAALAAQFTSATMIGQLGDRLRAGTTQSWPWDEITCIPYALPVVADPEMKAAFNLMTNCRYIWVAGDVIVTAGSFAPGKVVKVKGEHVGAGVKLQKPPGVTEFGHEPHVIRAAIVHDANAIRTLPNFLKNATPWADFETFDKMLRGDAKTYVRPGAQSADLITPQNLKDVLNGCNFGPEFGFFLHCLQDTIGKRSSYKGFTRAKTIRERKRLLDHAETGLTLLQGNPTQVTQALVTELKNLEGLHGSANEDFLGLGLVLNAIQTTQLTVNHVRGNPTLKKCFTSKLT